MKKKEVVSSLIFKFVERLSAKGLGFVIGIVLARLLSPEEFGEIAVVMVFINLSLTIIESGLSTALVQSREADELDFSTVFYISSALALLMVVLIYFTAPLIAAYYKSPHLLWPLRVYSLSLFFGALNSVQVAKVQRGMLFKQQLRCSLIATTISGALGIAMAYMGHGLWSLVGYYFAQTVVSCIALCFAIHWLPQGGFSAASAKRLFRFGSGMLATGLMTALYNDLRTLIIGKRFSTEDLGYYSRGQQFTTVISVNIDSALQSVMFPVYSRSQDYQEHLRAMVRRSLSLAATIVFPLMLGMAAVAEPMVRLLLTDKWLPCVIFIRLLCLGDAALPITSTNLVALKASGDSKAYVKLELVRRAVMLVVLLVSVFAFNSVRAIACGYVLSAWLDWIIAAQPIKTHYGYGLGAQVKDIWKAGASAVIMFLAVSAVALAPLPLWLTLLVQLAVGVAVYCGACLILKAEGFMYALSMVKAYLGGKGKAHEI